MLRQPKAGATEAERRRSDALLMKQLKIVHKPQVSAKYWPTNHSRTFEAIQTLGSLQSKNYIPESSIPDEGRSWKRETFVRAEKTADIAQRLIKENPSEMTWRLELENLIFERFSSMTEW
jgi:hypothetical protein